MRLLRPSISLLFVVCALLALGASPSMAVVGGDDAEPGEYPAVAEITFGVFGCTGTLIAPEWVLSAGHCGSLTGGTGASTPVAWPAAAIDVRIGGDRYGSGERVPVRRAIVHPKHFLNLGYDISLLRLRRPSTKAPVQVAGDGERSIWLPGTLATIVGWGATENGDFPDRLQEARVPITSDAYCGAAYPEFEAKTMVCAGYPEGGVDTCQGDSGGPLFGRAASGALRVVGATSFGEGCGRRGRPGVYARVADDTLREWIRSKAPAGVN